MKEASTLFRLLGDEARLRLLRLLAKERLNVGELTAVLGIAQSGVSRHLGLLRDAGLVTEERAGGFTFLRATPDADDPLLGPVWALLRTRFEGARRNAVVRGDEARLRVVLRQRREQAEDHGGATSPGARQLVPGRSWAAWSRGLGLLLPPLTVADLGCGEGYLTLEVARWAGHVIAVDRSARVLDRARALATRRRVENVEWRRGEIEQIPLDAGAVDVALLSQALHHARDPRRALREAARVVVDGGRVLVLDLQAHAEDWTTERLGDRWLGFSTEAVTEMLAQAGLVEVVVRPATENTGDDPFGVLTAVGTKPVEVAASGGSPLPTHGNAPRADIDGAPTPRGGRRQHTGNIRPRHNADRADAAPTECSGTCTTGCERDTNNDDTSHDRADRRAAGSPGWRRHASSPRDPARRAHPRHGRRHGHHDPTSGAR